MSLRMLFLKNDAAGAANNDRRKKNRGTLSQSQELAGLNLGSCRHILNEHRSDFEKKWENEIEQFEPESTDGVISLTEFRIR